MARRGQGGMLPPLKLVPRYMDGADAEWLRVRTGWQCAGRAGERRGWYVDGMDGWCEWRCVRGIRVSGFMRARLLTRTT